MTKLPNKVRHDPLWKDIYDFVVLMYGKIDELLASVPDEKWNTATKLRNAANDTLFYASQAVGNVETAMSIYDWNFVRKNLFTMQAMYTFATKQKFLELDPELIVQIDGLIAKVDGRHANSLKADEKRNQAELEPWLEKYRIWQKMQD